MEWINNLLSMQINLMMLVVGFATMLTMWALWRARERVDCMDLFTSPSGRLSRTAMGQTGGIIVAIWAPVFTTLQDKLDPTVLAVSLAYLGTVEGYAKYLRFKSENESNRSQEQRSRDRSVD